MARKVWIPECPAIAYGIFWEGGVYSGRVACRCLKVGVLGRRWIPGVSHKDVLGREGSIMGVSHIVVRRGWILEGWVYSGRVAFLRGGGYILGGRGRFWEHRISL